MQSKLFSLMDLISFGDAEVFYNASHPKPHLLLLQSKESELQQVAGDGEKVTVISLESGLEISSWRIAGLVNAYLKQATLSLDFLFIGLLKSSKLLEVRKLFDEGDVLSINLKDSMRESILGFEWTFPGELLVILNTGLEFYQSVGSKLVKSKSIRISIGLYKYWTERKLLILNNGTLNLFLYRILPKSNTEPFPTLSPNPPRGKRNQMDLLSLQITRRNVHAMTYYGHNYIGILSSWNERKIPTLSLYRITTKSSYRKEYELDLQFPSDEFMFHIIDDLLVAHNLTYEHSLIFDVKSLKPDQSLIAPNSDIFKELNLLEVKREVMEDQSVLSSLSPTNIIISNSAGKAFKLRIDLSALLGTFYQRRDSNISEALDFVIRRNQEKSYDLRMDPVLHAMSSKVDSSTIRSLLDCLQLNFDSSKAAVMKGSTSVESLVSKLSSGFGGGSSASLPLKLSQMAIDEDGDKFQSDIFICLFVPSTSSLPDDYIIAIVLEFINSQQAFGKGVCSFIFDFLTQLLFDSSSFVELHQLIQFGLIPDSLSLATSLLADSRTNNIYFGLDMLKRMNYHDRVLNAFTTSGQLIESIHYAKQCNILMKLSPAPFLDAALVIGDDLLYMNLYRFFEEVGLIPLSNQFDLDSGEFRHLARYLSIFREKVGPLIEMERVH